MRPDTIYIDMDGVIADLLRAILEDKGIPKEETVRIQKFDHDLYQVVGMSKPELWESVNTLQFWQNIPAFPWAVNLLSEARRLTPNVHIVSSPAGGVWSMAGKLDWLTTHFGATGPKGFRDYVFTPHKELLARPNVVLIDDREDYCERFTNAGGMALLFPAPDNKLRSYAGVQGFVHTVNHLRVLFSHGV